MAGQKDLLVRLQALGGVWEVPGADRERGVFAENVSLEADKSGPSRASFDLRRDPSSFWPDLTAFTPVDVEEGGIPIWSGRIAETPSRDGANRVMNVQCEGWQYHLDDDVIEDNWVHARLSDFQDIRSVPGAALGGNNNYAAGTVVNDNGSLMLMMPSGAPVLTGTQVAVTLDLGPVSRPAKRVSVDYESTGNGSAAFVVRAASGRVGGGTFSDAVNFTLSTAASGTTSGTFSSPQRYVFLIFSWTGAGSTTGPATGDAYVRINGLRIYTDTTYESANQSILKASTVVTSMLAGAPLLSTDTSRIQATSFNFREYAPGESRTPRQHIDAVNAAHNWLAQVDVNRRLVFRPQPSAPLYEIGPWSAVEVNDASSGSGEEIYDTAIVQGQTAAGDTVRTVRTQPTPTMVTRRGFHRTKLLPISAKIDATDAAVIGDTWLPDHKTTPFRGTVTLVGDRSLRDVLSGEDVPLGRLLLAGGELLRFSDRVDPDTGGHGRDGRIAAVTYTPATATATVTIDNSRANFEALMSRLSIIQDTA